VGDRPRRRIGPPLSVPAKEVRGACPEPLGPLRLGPQVFSGPPVVRIEERTPVAMVNLDVLHYLDEEGRPFKRLTAYDPKNLAIVTGFSRKDLLRRTR